MTVAQRKFPGGDLMTPGEDAAYCMGRDENIATFLNMRKSLRGLGLKLEAAAGALNSSAQRFVEGKATDTELEERDWQFAKAKADFEAGTEALTGINPATVARWINL